MRDSQIDPRLTVNEILTQNPAAITVLNGFGIDSCCCGGGTSLTAVAHHHDLHLDAIVSALEAAMPIATT